MRPKWRGHYIVLVFSSESEQDDDKCTEQMHEVADFLKDVKANFKKLTAKEVLSLEPSVEAGNQSCYIMPIVKGEAFSYILSELKSRVISPSAFLMALKHNIRLHSVSSRVLASVAMNNVVVSCTGVDPETRSKVRELVELMAGKYSGDLNYNTTHLVCDSVGSKKYIVATQMKINILLPSWVTETYKKRSQLFMATNQNYMKQFKVPIFAGCVICVSGINLADRKQIQQTVLANGGVYSPELTAKRVTHLVATEHAKYQQKMIYAKKWNIPVVTLNWFYDSLSKGYCRDPNLYSLSQPDEEPRASGINILPNENFICSANSMCNENLNSSKNGFCNISQLLSFCKAHIFGLNSTKEREIEVQLQKCGATVYKLYQQGVTHIISESMPSSEFLKSSKADDCCYVKPGWVFDCIKSEQVLPTEPYSHPIPSVEITPLVKRTKILSGTQTLNESSAISSNRLKKIQRTSSSITMDDEINRCYFESSNDQSKMKQLFDEFCVFCHRNHAENDDNFDSLKAAVLEMGGKLSDNLNISCTHFVVSDSVLAEHDDVIRKAKSFSLKIVSPQWVFESQKRGEVLDFKLFEAKPLKTIENSDARRMSGRSRVKNLKSLEPAPIPAEETANDSGIDTEINSTAGKSHILPKPQNSATPSKLNFDLRGSLAKLKSTTPSSVGKATSLSSQKSKDSSTDMINDRKYDDSVFAQPTVPISSNILSKFQKNSDAFNECSQSVQIGWEAESNSFGNNNTSNENCNETEEGKSIGSGAMFEMGKKKPRVFQVTNLPSEQRLLAKHMTEELGGRFSSVDAFDLQSTHLLCKVPMKSEKFLASVARGLWVLSYDYLEQSLKAGRFLNEEDFEWGSEKLGLASIHSNHIKLATSARRWRLALSGGRDIGAYSNWKVLLHVPKNKIKGLSSILNAGGAEILEIQPPFSNVYLATHAFIERDKVDCGLINCSQLCSVGINCLKPEYIADFLIHENVNIEAYRVADAPEAMEPVCKRVRMI